LIRRCLAKKNPSKTVFDVLNDAHRISRLLSSPLN